MNHGIMRGRTNTDNSLKFFHNHLILAIHDRVGALEGGWQYLLSLFLKLSCRGGGGGGYGCTFILKLV